MMGVRGSSSTKPHLLWHACLEELDGRHPALALYLAGSTARRVDGRLEISVSTERARAWLDTILRPVFEQTIHQMTGESLPVVFQVFS